MAKYKLLDCGNQKKVEQLGEYKVIRPCPQAMWEPTNLSLWEDANSEYVQTSGESGQWKNLKPDPALKRNKAGSGLEDSWLVESPDGLQWEIEPNEYGNIGIFTEHWMYAPALGDQFKKGGKILNLFTYSGSNCVTLADQGYKITAVDSSKAAMDRYTYNLELNGIKREGQKLVLEDVFKFVSREVRRGAVYDGVMIDAPSYGRGTKGEVFKIEEDLVKLLQACDQLLSKTGLMVITLHSPRFTPAILQIMMSKLFPTRKVETSEIVPICESGVGLPSGFLVKVR
jgi:23S rRNA (cytosine1962-C5)-methyltransferase